jgi:TIR domain
MKEKKWDIFISHAREDKEDVVRPLAEALKRAGVKVWLDEHELKLGDSLSEKIDEGLSESSFGAVILSPAFLAKHWPKRELAGLRAREEEGKKVILPVWHNLDKPTVSQFSPILADALAASTGQGIDNVVKSILDVIFAPTSDSPSAKNPSVARRLIEILESRPKKTTFIAFLKSHLQRTNRYLGWGGPSILEEYELEGSKFDAYAPYVGHGCCLTLVSFTEAWTDPFELAHEAGGVPAICSEIEHTISRIRSIQQRFAADAKAQARLRNELIRAYGGGFPRSYLLGLERCPPELQFFMYAGRRSYIDADTDRHHTWSRLLKNNSSVSIKTYDNIIDMFLE